MTRNAHYEARELIAVGNGLPDPQQAWLRAHLDECEACRDYFEAANGVVRTLRSLPLAADARLVRATQMRVRFHASRLRETRERMWLVGMACLGVGLSATLTIPFCGDSLPGWVNGPESRPWSGRRASCFSSLRRRWW